MALSFDICIHYKVITTTSLVAIHHHMVDALHPFCPPTHPLPLW